MITARQEAATILRRIVEAVPLPASVASYLRGYADGLEAQATTRASRRA